MKFLYIPMLVTLAACGSESVTNTDNEGNQDQPEVTRVSTDIKDYTDMITGRDLNEVSLKGIWAVTEVSTHEWEERTDYWKIRSIVKIEEANSTLSAASCLPVVTMEPISEGSASMLLSHKASEGGVVSDRLVGDGNRISIEYSVVQNSGAYKLSKIIEMVKLSDDLRNIGNITSIAQSTDQTINDVTDMKCFVEKEQKIVSDKFDMKNYSVFVYGDNGSELILAKTYIDTENEMPFIRHGLSNGQSITSNNDFSIPDTTITTSSGTYSATNSVYTSSSFIFEFSLNL